ncbi:hypothetical protein CH063_02058 [Colletotrichum higginsianum]|uniref:Ricin B lectin domain-containing protein n=1 Tax=Colletotrichum higginsianum (strain IMI 349063) TaxID=759273 RepID=H1VFU6_COLHI|nr:hypothetical protein CH063_02058 [Colletotrichum higginsianum]
MGPDTDRRDTPWPGNTFRIIEGSTRKAITFADQQVSLRKPKGDRNPSEMWYCIEKDGYFGFQNPRTGRYLGHDGKDIDSGIRTTNYLREWELWTPRRHPEGGYQLLSPSASGSSALRVVCVAENGTHLTRRHHGTTVWEFVRV